MTTLAKYVKRSDELKQAYKELVAERLKRLGE